ncbi:hypothetical protein KXD40_005134 [Peronospora effusa]|uniref:Temptin Cys/Cys disulfide domain-containing protein n=1 Tax=Peronospora effusa TaxID=542832 RepID=A0A425CP05_9STRA|nr:hypothetical protein DD237_000938 [Peronospora effusa]UIZ22387.1 hypothetical protein KXD40_005134 [Peronospora effusa]CAI5700593.1 unnamed protein product [Peronospora effusa]
MKTYTTLTLSALIVASTINSASAFEKFCKDIPNAENFCEKKLGHDGDANNALGEAFGSNNNVWTKEVCNTPFDKANPKITSGAVLGDPCCKWKKGETPLITLTKFDPSDAKTCPTGGDEGGDSGKGNGQTDPTNTKGELPETSETTNTKEEATDPTNTKGELPGASTPETPPSETSPDQENASTPPTEAPQAETNVKEEPPAAQSEASPDQANPSTSPTAGRGCAAKGARKLRS